MMGRSGSPNITMPHDALGHHTTPGRDAIAVLKANSWYCRYSSSGSSCLSCSTLNSEPQSGARHRIDDTFPSEILAVK